MPTERYCACVCDLVLSEDWDTTESLASLARALAVDPQDPRPYRWVGHILRRLGEETAGNHALDTGWKLNAEMLRGAWPKFAARMIRGGDLKREKQAYYSDSGVSGGP